MAESEAVPAAGQHVDERLQRQSGLRKLLSRPELGAIAGTVLVFLFFGATAHGTGMFAADGIMNWITVTAQLTIIATGAALLMVGGEFDLSVGSMIGFAGMMIAIPTVYFGWPIEASVVFAFCGALLIGFLNGLVVVRTRLPSFIVTLASNFIVIGATMGFSRLVANVTSSSIVSDDSAKFVFAARWGQANISILWWLAVALVGGFVLGRTTFGNWIYATGGNLQAARGAGVPVERVKVTLFVATGVAAAFIGVLQGVEWNSGNSTYGMGYVFQAPIVAVIGGVLLSGGYGSVPGIFLGTAIFGVISTGIFYTGWSTDWIQLFLGVLLGGAVLANNYVRRLATTA